VELRNNASSILIENTLRALQMLGDISKAEKILYRWLDIPTMRKSIYGLAAIFSTELSIESFHIVYSSSAVDDVIG
jgi:hypothetical protein